MTNFPFNFALVLGSEVYMRNLLVISHIKLVAIEIYLTGKTGTCIYLYAYGCKYCC